MYFVDLNYFSREYGLSVAVQHWNVWIKILKIELNLRFLKDVIYKQLLIYLRCYDLFSYTNIPKLHHFHSSPLFHTSLANILNKKVKKNYSEHKQTHTLFLCDNTFMKYLRMWDNVYDFFFQYPFLCLDFRFPSSSLLRLTSMNVIQ